MAFAIASGAKPEHGIYTAIIAGLVVSTCGGTRLQIATLMAGVMVLALPGLHPATTALATLSLLVVVYIVELVGPAFTIAMLCSIESLLSAVVADGMAGTRHDSNQELIGQGLANIATPFFGGFAATGAIARTATNVHNGGTSPLAGVVHSATLVLVILFLAPLAADVPLAALAAILFVVAWNMSEARRFAGMLRRAPTADVAILLVTFGLTVFVDLVVAVNIGVILATLHFLRRMSASVEVQAVGAQEVNAELPGRGIETLPADVLVYKVEGPFFFGAVENFEHALAYTHTDPRVLIFRLRWVPFMDITGVQALEEAIRDLQRRGVRVMMTGANERVTAKLERAGVIALIGRDNFLELCVLARRAARLLDRVLLRVERELAPRGSDEVDVEAVSEAQQVEQHVGQLEGDPCALFLGQRRALLRRQPLEVLQHLGGFHGECRREIFRRMELFPVSLRREGAQRTRKLGQWPRLCHFFATNVRPSAADGSPRAGVRQAS